jgi:hypothetical protein
MRSPGYPQVKSQVTNIGRAWESGSMGWRGNFVLVHDADPGALAARMGGRLSPTELTFDDALDVAPGPAVGPLLDGWRLVIDQHWQLVDDPQLRDLSAGGQVVQYGVVEQVSFATATGWHDGVEVWSVTFDEGRLTRRGDPPDADDGDDGFDAVLNAVTEVTGWAYHGDDASYRPIVGLGELPATPLVDEVDAGLTERLTGLGLTHRRGREYDLEVGPGVRGYVRVDVRTAVEDGIESVTLSPRVGAHRDRTEEVFGQVGLAQLDPRGRVRPRPGLVAALFGRERGATWRVYRPWPLPRRYRRRLRWWRWSDRFPYGPVDPILDDVAGAVARCGLPYLRRLAEKS